MLDRRKQLQSAHLSGRNAAQERERGLPSFPAAEVWFFSWWKVRGQSKKKKTQLPHNPSEHVCELLAQKSLCVFPPHLLLWSRFFPLGCLHSPRGGIMFELSSNLLKVFFFFFFTCFYSRWRRWKRITRQMGETGGMTGNDGFVAMQWMNGTRHSPLSCRKHPKPTLRSSVCLCFDTLSTSCFMDNHAPNVMLKRTFK